jgi:hypothetical protein
MASFRASTIFIADRVAVTSATFTVRPRDRIIGVSFAGVVTITLPSATGVDGRYIVKDESGAAAANNITVQGPSGQTIDGAATNTISTNYGVRGYYSNRTNWFTA